MIWFGGKSKYAEHIISKFPSHRVYVEPFGGAATVIAQKTRATHEVYNDIDGNVVNFLLTAMDDPDRLSKSCEEIPYSRKLYESWKKEQLPVDPFDRAVRWFYPGISSGNAQDVSQTGWRHSVWSGQNPSNGYISACQMIREFAKRMQGVMIEQADFRSIFAKYDSDQTLWYVDPPYVGREKYYAGNFTEQDHRDLAMILKGIKGKAIISYYDDPLIDELYPGWNRETFGTFKQVVGGEGENSPAEELLLLNFDNGQLTLF
ncbi:DNA adenine methylase [compost metagenome]